MKRFLFACMAWLLSLTLQAQDRSLGLGMILGEPTGFSAKIWTSPQMAIDAGIAWSFKETGYPRVHADFLWHRDVWELERGRLPLYYGVGAKLLMFSELGFGIRVPVGIAYELDQSPVDVFLELVPGLKLLPGTSLDLDLAVGARYFL
jgi:hypothetical protein